MSETRRRFLHLSGSAATLGLAGCAAPVGSQSQSDVEITATQRADSTPSGGNSSHSGLNDHDGRSGAGSSHVTVKMTTASDSSYRFTPRIIRVPKGGTVKWTVMSGAHTTTAYHPENGKPVRLPKDGSPWDSGILQVGESFNHTFETEGVYNYFCMPHEGNGMVGMVIVGNPDPDKQPGLATPQERLPTQAKQTLTELIKTVEQRLGVLGLPKTAEVSMTVADDGTFIFDPEIVRVRNGGVVKWTVESGAHTATAYHTGNGKPQRVPDSTPAWNSGLLEKGQTFKQRFTTAGVYDYLCMPHETRGMVGSVIVGDPQPNNQPGLTNPQDVLPSPAQEKLTNLNQRVTQILKGKAQTGQQQSDEDQRESEQREGSTGGGSPVEVSMKAASDGTFVFEPEVVYVEPGDTIRWKRESGTHTTTAYHPDNDKPLRMPDEADGWDSGMLTESDQTFEHTFETAGVYDYFCVPHEAMGMIGSVVVGDPDLSDEPGLANPQDSLPAKAREAITRLNQTVKKKAGEGSTPTPEETTTPTPTLTPTPVSTPAGDVTQEEVVKYEFNPDLVHIQPGDTIEWTIEEGMHSITAYHSDNDKSQRIPDGAGSFDSGLLQSGETFKQTFEVEGVYDYYCQPHESMGMVGSIIVGDPDPDPAIEPGLAPPQDDVAAPDAIKDLNQRAIEELGGSPGGGTSTPTPTPTATSTATPTETSTRDGSSTTGDVSIPGERFEPDLVHIQPGDTVRWMWNDDDHTVTAYHPDNDKPRRIPDGAASFDSGIKSSGDTFERVFETVGVYDYHCMPHEPKGMVGSVIVGNPEDVGAEPGLASPQSNMPEEARSAIRQLNQRAKEKLGSGGNDSGSGSTGGGIETCGNPGVRDDGTIQIDIVGEVCQGNTVTVTATLDGSAATNADVSVNGDHVGTTDGNGQRDLSVPDEDRFRLEVETDDAEGEVRVQW